MTTTPPTTPKPRRRRLQFSLRTLLVLMLVFGVAFGWLGFRLKQVTEQQEAVEAIQKLGGFVFPGVTGPAWLRNVLGEDIFATFDAATVG